MKSRQLQVFILVVEHASIRGAARTLGVTQPAVTKSIRELERDLGVPLVERSFKGIRLTNYGSAFLPRARVLLSEMRRVREEIVQMRGDASGRIAVGVSASAAANILPAAFTTLRVRFPTVDIIFFEGSLTTLKAVLRDGTLDFAVVHHKTSDSDHEFDLINLQEFDLFIGARANHPLIQSQSLSQLHNAEWVLQNFFISVEEFKSWFATVDMPPPTRITEVQSDAVALALVGQTDLIGLFVEPLAAWNFSFPNIRAIQVQESLPKMDMCVMLKKGIALTPSARHFLECLKLNAER